ncbi:MAG: hypothetical protein IKV21_03970 [Clostridia bacterium]|nr:hypothetical protein [Clostridia bacterium]
MNHFLEYIDKSFENMKETESLYRYKQKLIAEMTQRANELVASGLKDDKIIAAIIMEEYPDLQAKYKATVKEKTAMSKKARKGSLLALGTFGGIFAAVCLYLAVSFMTNAWGKTWMLLLGGIFAVLVFLFSAIAGKLIRKTGKYNIVSRLLSFVSVMLVGVYVFLFTTVITPIKGSWLVFILAVAFSMILDMLLSLKYNKKTGIISVLLYIPVVFTLFYVVLGVAGILPWHPGWLLILFGIFVDFVVAGIRIVFGTKVKVEEDDSWSED